MFNNVLHTEKKLFTEMFKKLLLEKEYSQKKSF